MYAAVILSGACSPDDRPAEPVEAAPGEIIGRVEIAEGVPYSGCRVLLEGTPLGSPCDASGGFDLRNVPPGRWDLRIVPDAGARSLPARRLVAAANSGFVSDLGAVRLLPAGAVGGRLLQGDAAALDAVIAVPGYGVVGAPNDNGGYLLTGVPAGVHDVVLFVGSGFAVRTGVTVLPGQATLGVSFDLGKLQPSTVKISGLAVRGDHDLVADDSGLYVELVDARTARVVTHTTTTESGAFAVSAWPGAYVVRAHDGDNPIVAIVPSLVAYGPAPVVVPATLHVPRAGCDLDGDGATGDLDPDSDGDGVLDGSDAFAYDPAESFDSDHDGLGDRADLSTSGDGRLDQQNPTPDSDGDGRLDFEDNCPAVANPGQDDTLGDGTGDACR